MSLSVSFGHGQPVAEIELSIVPPAPPALEGTLTAAVSGYSGEEERRKATEVGFDRHLVKPTGRATLEELVRSTARA